MSKLKDLEWGKKKIPIRCSLFEEVHPPENPDIVAIDTETELILNKSTVPDLVIFQLYDGNEIQIVHWKHLGPYLKELRNSLRFGGTVFMHNAGFDVPVLQKYSETVCRTSSCDYDLWDNLLDNNKLLDTGLTSQLIDLAQDGMQNEKYPSLAELSLRYLGRKIAKDDRRVTFQRSRDPSVPQLEYAAIDAAVTRDVAIKMLSRYGKIPETLELQTKALVSLEAMSREGMLVDKDYLQKLIKTHTKEFEEAKEQLRLMGVIMKDRNLPNSAADCLAYVLGDDEVSGPLKKASRSVGMMLYIAPYILKGEELPDVESIGKKLPDKSEMTERIFKLVGVEEVPDENGKIAPLSLKTVSYLLWYFDQARRKHMPLGEARVYAGRMYTEYEGWRNTEGSDTAVQRLLSVAEKELGTTFPRTATGRISTDDNALAMLPTDHPFLEVYKKYKSEEKLLSTYVTEKHIQPDGRVHPRFSVIVRTGRTSCSNPNLQNPPKDGNIRDMYICPHNHLLLSADYSQLELCALAHNCYMKYGVSKMRDVINAGLDIHAWLALQLLKIPGLPSPDPTNVKAIDTLKEIIESKASDYTTPERFAELRQASKAADFGFPGGLGAKTFIPYAAGYGVTLTEEEAINLKQVWMDSFPEMKHHFNLQPSAFTDGYRSVTLTGRVRENASYCAAANCEFQGLSADGSKAAMWKLYKRKYKVCNFIHDEFLVYVPGPIYVAATQAHDIAKIMADSMGDVLESMRVAVEWEITTKWTKDKKVKKLAEGNYIHEPNNLE